MQTRQLAAISGVAAVIVMTVWVAAGLGGVLYAALFVVAVAPGIALGCAVFGRRHPAGWVTGAALGYGTTQLALWLPMAVHMPGPLAFVLCWLLQAVLLVIAGRLWSGPQVKSNAWTRADTRAFACVLLLVPLLMCLPYSHIGAEKPSGARSYRAYFTADFVWHMALASEIGKYAMPPQNPYLAPEPIHYYWTYFLLPAVVAHDGPAPIRDVQATLKSNAVCSALLLFAMMFLVVRSAVPSAWKAATAVGLVVVAASAEGAWAIQTLFHAGKPLSDLTGLNIDAVTAWAPFNGLRIDGLPRGILYTPQHSFAGTLGLVALLTGTAEAGMFSARGIVVAGLALGLSTCFNPFVGIVFTAIYGGAALWSAVTARVPVLSIARLLLIVPPVALALAWSAANGVLSNVGAAVHVGFGGPAWHYPVATLLLAVGPVLLLALVGVWRIPGLDPHAGHAAIVGLALTLALMYFVTLDDAYWVGFRTGHILLLILTVLIARALWRLDQLRYGRALMLGSAILVLAVGLPTTLIDEFNAQDISNLSMGPGFHWTVVLSPKQLEALRWIKGHVPENDIVQMEPIVRGREQWSLIPSFAERRMAAGLPISLLPIPSYHNRSVEVRTLFRTTDAKEASRIARYFQIRYLYADSVDRAQYPEGVRKFGTSPDFFETVFDNGEASVYRVRSR